jgi:hypothetical protein
MRGLRHVRHVPGIFLGIEKEKRKRGGHRARDWVSEKNKSLYRTGWNMSHMSQSHRNLLIESALRVRHVALGRWRKVAHMARALLRRVLAPPLATPALSRLFGERWPKGGGGVFREQRVAIRRATQTPIGAPHWPRGGAPHRHKRYFPYYAETLLCGKALSCYVGKNVEN